MFRVALVDDESSVRKALTRLLRASGFDVVSHGSAVEFLYSLDQPSRFPACVIADQKMPEMSAVELRRCLASMHIDVPMIILSGSMEETGLHPDDIAGAVEFLPKPVDGPTLISMLQRMGRPILNA
jgi:FixJ family two-component response regulator